MRGKLAFAMSFSLAASLAMPVLAEKQGGTLRIYHRDNLPSAELVTSGPTAEWNKS